MNPIKRWPVATLTTIGTALDAGLAAILAAGVLPTKDAAWVGAAVAVLNVILGKAAWNASTPLARPRDALRRPLVPMIVKRDPDIPPLMSKEG